LSLVGAATVTRKMLSDLPRTNAVRRFGRKLSQRLPNRCAYRSV